jgi:hypothetical protein
MPSASDFLFSIGLQAGRYAHPLSLARHHAQVYSQNGEDGLIAEIFRRVGTTTRTFIEIGTESGRQNNTRLLLEAGWTGVWIDGDLSQAREIFADYVADGVLRLTQAWVTVDNVNALVDESQAPLDVDFLSLDIDQNTSHVWRALRRRARVSCIEYNASIPPTLDLAAAYDANAAWDGTNWFGAGLKSLERIGCEKGQRLVGCDLNGVNAFFVDEKEAKGRFKEPFTAEEHWEPPRYDLKVHAGHPPSAVARKWASDS